MAASAEAPAARPTAANVTDPDDREKDFFTTWLRLMERHKDLTDLTDALQSVMSRAGDACAKLQDARHQSNMLSASEKTVTELMAQLNDYFFRDIVPALKRAKQMQSEAQDPLDHYLENGEGGPAMPQNFVDDMSGWAGNGDDDEKKKDGQSTSPASRKERAGEDSLDDAESDDNITSYVLHDMLVLNGLKFTALQAPDYSGMRFAAGQQIQQQSAAPQAGEGDVSRQADSTASAAPAVKEDVKTNRRRAAPPPIVTDLPPRSNSSTPRTQSRSPVAPVRKDRIGKRTAANLTAEQVMGARTYGSVRKYLIRWKGVALPLWIARRKAPPQAKELIILYTAELRARDSAVASERAGQTGGEPPRGRKKTSRTGARPRQGQHNKVQPDFYTVDRIVDHRTFYSKRQYLVRWENYDASEDTWEDASKLRADVPDIVDAYEGQLARERDRAEAVQSAISELARDTAAGTRESAHKRGFSRGDVKAKGKRRRVVQNSGGKMKSEDADNTSEDDYQFTLEEAEVEELSDEEFADKLNT